MTVPPESAGTLSRSEKQELLRKILLEKIGRPRTAPTSFAQERLWFIDRLEPGSAVYNMPVAWRLGGALDEAALERTLGEIVRRHETLRTTFAEVDGSPVQVIVPFGAFALPVEDLSDLSEADREAALGRRAGEEARRAFDLSAGPLFRAALLRLGAEDHVLLLSMHHIVSDGWSMGVLFRELSALYEAYREGRESPLPELGVQYAEYAVWQRAQLAGEVLDRQLSYWRERLAGAPELLELPTDHPRPAVQSDRGRHEPVELSSELVERLRALGWSEGATLYMVLLGAFQVLLGKYGGSEDVVVGSPIAGRTRGEVGELIGFFVNTLVLRTDLSGDPSFREVLRRAREVTLGAYEHQEVPFERLVEELRPERSFSHSPLFQVMFALQNAGEGELRLGGVEMQALGTGEAAAKFDLSLVLGELDGGVAGAVAYRAELWEGATIRRMLGHFRAVLEALAGDPDRHLSSLELPAGEERRLLLDEWNRSGEAPDPAVRCVHELFAEQAERTPDAVALVYGDETLTYTELHRRSDALARRLAALGVGPEVRAGICVERGLEMVVGLLGILKAGGAYVPLDPQYPAERLAYMLADAGATLLLTQERLRDRLPAFGGDVVLLDGDGGTGDAASHSVPRAASPESLAYVIYTSGSTGLPKGTEVPHRAIPGFFRGAGYARFGEGAVVLQHSSVSWDALTLELWPALLSGGTCVLYPGQTSEPGLLGEQVRRHGVNTLWLTAAYFNLIVDTAPEILEGVAQVMTGGEAVSLPHVRRALELYPQLRLVNGYGPSETTVFAACYPVPAGFGAPSVPVGRPVGDRRVYLLDRHFCAVPLGAAGEVCIGGPAVARGYLGRPGLTAERFIPDPFGEPGARLYRSGDRARWRAEGKLEFVGRVDFQVKIRGFRVEPGEVEGVLRAWPGVREAAVVVREDQPGDRRLVAYVAGEVAADEVREHLRGQLPEHMLPAAFVFLEALPLTPNGKLDRKALPAPELASAEDRYVAPRTPVEEVLAGIWAEVLRLERVGVEESFFDLGGHSLLATRVVSRVREVFGVEVPLRALFEGPTVAELAGRVEEMRRAGEGGALPPLTPVAREAPLPLSFAQERLWFLHQMEPEGAGYNVPWSGRLRGCLDASALERALGELVRRHESLRTTFRPVEQGAVQIVHPAAPARLPVLDLTGLAPQAREDEARRLAREDAERPFDLERGPLLRATLMRLADEEHVLLLTMHHIVSDGWSMGVLFRELFTLYESLSRPSGAAPPASPLPPLAVQYADFAVWQRGWLQGEVLRRQLDWWRERLGGAPPALELPTDRPRPAVASSRGASHVFRLPADVTRGLRSLARREGATLYMVTHAALDLLLSRWSGQEDLVVGSPIAGRTQVGTEGLIGFFVNTLALRTDLSGDPTFGELLGRVRETALGAYAHQDLPFERLVEEVAPERGLSHTPLFQVMFALQNADSGGGSAIAGVRLEPLGGEVRTVRFDLELDLSEVGEELFGSLRFRTDLFAAAAMERFAAQYRVVLATAAASPEERLSRLAILPPEEARTLLAYGSGPACEDAGGVPVHRLFAAQAARTPEAPAVLFAGESLTYAELDVRAECLARRLRSRAVPGATIAVCLERGPWAVVALLAVWKMGGVYLPLDPSHPVERLSFFLHDSGAKLVVSDLTLAGALLEREADVLLLDPSAEGDLPGGDLEPRGGGDPGDLAYLIYTSGSTGTPKAVMVEHAQLTHTLRASLETLGFGADDVVAALASTAFDISLLELVTPLLAGAAVRLVPPALVQDPEALVDALADVSVLHAVPALMRQVAEAARGGGTLPSLRLLLVGGDSVPPDLLEDMREVFPDARTVVLYGPTEAAIICATYAVPAEGAVAGHPLGRPLPGVRLAVRGPRGELAPIGVPGEVWISGGGVARGYLGRPELNAEKFVGAGTERAYRTGDRARWRADGVLEFLGRTDEQVKVRGFRIEPGEVEAVLRGQPGVREAVVLAREDAPGDRRLVAYVVPGADGVETAGGKEQVSEWETLFDDTYAQDEEEADPTLQLKGWNSSYTGEPIPREEMRAWVEHTAERILALGPERVLEVGCGTGLLLFRVAPHTRAYHGTDFSGVALEHVRRHVAGLPQVSLSEREADRLDDYAGAGFDLVVVNSVAQYFPDVDYLLRVLEGAAAALRPGGRIFVGDVRSLPLAGAFHASVELARAPEGLPTEQLQARVRRGMAEEQELLLDPALFEVVRARMPRLGRVEVQVKRGEYDNEVSRFRYDVVLHLDVAAAPTAPVVREWSGEDADGLRALAEGSASALLVSGVPDARVREHVRVLELISSARGAATAGEARVLADAGAGDGVQPEALFALGEEMGCAVEVRPGASGTLDVLFHPAAEVAHFPVAVDAERPWESYANDPQWGRRMRALVPALREAARARLPEYMVPSAFVVLEALPVTANGKVDRAALPAPDTLGSRGGTYVAPRTPAEERMAGIWAEVLGVERVGAEDHFFDLGGHSLLATQLVSRVREAFRTELPLRAVFEAPTLAELARRVEALRAEAVADTGAPPLVPVPRDGSPLPLSFAQQRLWFIDQLEPGSTAYHMPSVLRLHGPLDARLLERALGEVVRRHEALRTTFEETEGVPFQVVHPAGAARLELIDLSHLAAGEREAEARRLVREEAQRPFDLRAGPLLRTRLLRLGKDDHVLVLVMHHVVSDGWSMGVLFRELGALYAAFTRGEPSPLPELPVQYADFAVWQRAWLSGDVLEEQIAYWKERLAGVPPLLEIPLDRPRASGQSARAGSHRFILPPGVAEGLRALSRAEGTTLFMTILAGWQALLGRWAAEDDVVVGTPIAGRTRRETEGLIGFFVNMLPLRAELGGDPTWRELLERVRGSALGAYAYEQLPFERLVEELGVERSLTHEPVFQVIFALQRSAGEERLSLDQVEMEPFGAGAGVVRYDLELMVVEEQGALAAILSYREALFEAGTVARLAGHLESVLEAMSGDPARRLSELSLLRGSERAQVLEAWNATAAELPRACIHELFTEQAARTPEAVAVVFRDESVTYAELDRSSDRLALSLRRLGVAPETRVGLCVQRSSGMLVGILGILKAGGVYVPLDPAYPGERLAYMLADSGAAVLLAESALQDALPSFEGVRVLLDAPREADSAKSDVPPAPRVLLENAAYVIYTSGSTGKPKGVVVTHGNAASRLPDAVRIFGAAPGSRMLLTASLSFDASLVEMFVPLLSGAALHVAEREGVLSPERLGGLLREREIDVWVSTPALLDSLPEADFPALRTVSTGGERCSAEMAARWSRGRRLMNMYGPTETTIYTTAHACAPGVAEAPPIGRPVANARVYVLDAWGEPAPIGVPGELHVGGAGVARGYLGRAELTAERFVPDAFGGEAGGRLYRTGDRARWRAGGELEFLGRVDAQVKIRGFRIEPGEIEGALRQASGVTDCAVVAREDVPREKRLVAYVVGDVEAGALREHLRRELPEYMVPAAFVPLERLPLTPGGKVDRKALPAPEDDAYARRGYEAPVGETEAALAEIWAEVLRLERVGRQDHFFELGGHSLLSVRVISRVRQVLGAEVAIAALFDHPVLADLARAIDDAGRTELLPIEPADRSVPLPLSFAQQRLWFLEQLGDLGSMYHMPTRLRLGGELDRAALRRALDAMLARHEALRTTFVEVEGEPVQRIAEESRFHLLEHDLGGDADAAAELRRLAAEEAGALFDLERGPLIRGRLVRLAEDDHVLLLTMHHIVSDGWSTEVLTRELGTLYDAFRRGEANPLAPLPVQYADYAAWQRKWVAGEVLREQAEYWKAALSGAPELLELPTDRPRPARQDHAGAAVGIDLGDALSAGLKALSQRHGITLHMTLVAGWAAVLGRLSGQEDVVVGTPSANRGRREIEGLIGFFVNTLALRIELGGSPSVSDLLGRVRERALGAQQNQDIPFEQVVELVQPARSLAQTPLFQVMFSWQTAAEGRLELPGFRLGGVGVPSQVPAKFDLSLSLGEAGGRIAGSVTYATALFDQATVERYLAYLRRVLEAFAADDLQSVDALPLLPDAERRRVVEEWNATGAAYPSARVHELFAAQAARTPEAVAVVFGEERVTYAELDARSNRLARHLGTLGVGPDARVGLFLERSAETVVGVLAILKAGGAYVALDPSYPDERLRFMLRDAEARALVTRTSLEGRLGEWGGPTVRVDVDAEAIARRSADAPAVSVSLENLAYVIYTSGSTGEPKGVLVEHGSLSNYLAFFDREILGEGFALPMVSRLSFDAHVRQLYPPLLRGEAVWVLPEEVLTDPVAILDALASRERVSFGGVPTLWSAVLDAIESGAHPVPGDLRAVLLGGEALPPELVRRTLAWFPGARIWNHYGPTEATVNITVARVEDADRVNLGRPIANVRVYLLDAHGNPVPAGIAGELYVGGVGVSRGYLGRPALTAEKYLPDPFSGEPGARVYRSGDRVRWLANGELEYLGRVDHQVKVRGFRVELGEIEARLRQHAEVRDAVVVAREDAPGDGRLVAYYVGDAPEAEALRGHLSTSLPEHMLPAAYVRLEALPLTPNGKVDRKALPAPEDGAYVTHAYEAPLGEAEEALAEIWSDVLGIDRIGRRDHFFELGGHSLVAVQVISRVRQTLGVQAALGDVFLRPVLADFARGMEQAGRAELPPIEPVERTGRLPLSFAQQRLWFLEQMGGMGSTYHIPRRLRLRGELDADALARALDRIVARHEALRTTCVEVEGEPVQRIAPVGESGFQLAEHDLSTHPAAEPELRRLAAEEAGAPFDLERGPLIRGRLIRLAADDHVLLLTMHHIVSDGWSSGVLTNELSTLYGAFRRGEPDPLPPLPVQYADYAAWQRRWVDGDVLREQTEYWTRALAGAPELLELPTDRPRPARQDYVGAAVGIDLGDELSAGLRALSHRRGTTLFMTLLAGWAAVLGRLSGQEDVVVGTPSANRGRREIEGLIGFFVNTLALRIELGGSPSVSDLLGRVRERALEAQHHQDIPFEQVVELVQPVRSLAHSPLFQVMFAWQNVSGGRLELPGLRLGGVGVPSQVPAKFDLSLSLGEAGGRIAGSVTYATALFEQATVERYLGYLRRVLEAFAADDLQAVDALPLLPDAERRLVMEEWNATGAAYPSERVHELFAAQAARTPEAVAVVFGAETLTYGELEARSNRLARHLGTLGVGPDARVGLFLERSVETVVGVLAILKAGGAYVALDPSYPNERLRFMLRDAEARALVTRTSLEGRLGGWGGPTVRVDADAEAIARRSADAPAVSVSPENLVYVIYTSGSTGEPKGVLIEHGSLSNYLAFFDREILAEGFALPMVSRLSFDAHVRQLYPPLLRGEAVWVLPEEVVTDPLAILDALASRERVSFGGVPSLWSAVLDAVESGRHRIPGDLRAVLLGGEALPPELVRRTLARFPGARIWNHYGPTEATVNTTVARVEDADRVNLGRPIANVRVYLLDGRWAPVPTGVAGELYVGGVGVSRGYLGRPALTAEKYLPDPFSGEPGARVYRSGDRVRWLANGELEYLGRVDHQVKVRGFRIELGEIEARLRQHAEVRDAVVVAREDAPGDGRLVAYYVGGALEAEALRGHLSTSLPEHMVPAAYVRLEALPLTPNGKVDRKALPAPEGEAVAARAYEAPLGEAEEALAEIWSDVLGIDRIGRHDNFFELGGHSLLAVRVISRVRQTLGVQAALGDVFLRPVLADFARGLEQAGRADLPPIEPVERTDRLPLSFAQQRLWFLEQMGGMGSTYHIPKRLRLRGEMDADALARALERIVARHEALRTTFVEVEGEPVQRIAAESRFHPLEHDLGGHPDAAAELRRLIDEEARAPFDLERGPLIRGRLIRLAADDHVLLLTMHHIVSDGWSSGVLTNELSALYGAFRRGDPDPLPPLPVQYADYAAWQRTWVAGEVLREQAEYWKAALAGTPELLELPIDRPRPARQDHVGATVGIVLGDELSAGLKALSQRHGTTLFMTLLAGWAAVLSRLSGQEEVVVGTPSANRGRREIEGLIGFFVNTLALRIELGGSPSVSDLLGRVRERALGAQQHQDIPFEQVVELVQPARNLAHSPLFQVMFAWQNAPRGGLELPGLTLGSLGSAGSAGSPSQAAAKFDLSLSLGEAGGRIAGSVTYATALFEPATVERHLAYLHRVLEAFAADPLQAVGALPLLPEAERRLVVEEWNRTEAAYPRDACVHELFEAQVERTPDGVAVVFGEEEALSYAELNRRANRLAHHLRTLGVGPDARVAICVERSPEMVVGVLGVLKAGGAYVPLDPAYPVERLRYMLSDSAPTVALTQSSIVAAEDGLFAGLGVEVLALDAPAWREQAATNPELGELGPEHLAYVIYTSGSTGTPKGVMVAHRNVASLVAAAQGHTLGVDAASRVLQFASFSFDASVFEMVMALCRGALLHLPPGADLLAGEALERVVARGRITHVTLPPAVLPTLSHDTDLAPVRTMVLAGETLPEAAVKRWAGGRTLLNAYGPTEATVWATFHECRTDEGGDPPIGRPIINARVYVLDGGGEPAPVGVAGELYIGGAGVARGYLGRPALTAERFVPDPFGGEPGARLYRTGDLGRWKEPPSAEVRECGSALDSREGQRTPALPHSRTAVLEFLGRNDFQVKIRGFRVELGEIEARLLEHPQVREAVVIAREGAAGDRRLAAYYTSDAVLEIEPLRAHLSARLPEHMVPAAYVRLEALPLTPNGKLDRKALPAPEGDAYARRGYEAPVGETEQALAEVWSELLGVERAGRWDHFFELGGHSLLAVRVISRVRQVLGAEVGIADLFERPVLADFARGVEEAARTELPPIQPVERTAPLPLSFAQQRLWFLERMGDLGSTYHVPTRLRLGGELDRAALRRALDAMLARHEALRTTFVQVEGEPLQRIAPVEETRFHLAEHDLGGHPDAAAQLHRLAAEEAGAPFDLERGPLIRGRLVRLAEDDHVLLMTMHHIVSDGWSMEVLTRELGTLYDAFRRGEANPLPPLPVQYADYAAWQRAWVDGEVLREQAEYWTQTLAGAPELLELPTDHPRPARQSHAGGTVGIDLGEALTAGLKALGQRRGTTLFMTLLAGWAAVLARLSGQEDVVVGTPSANRGRAEIEGLIGFFVNTLALRVDLSGSPSVAELLERVRARSLGAQHHQDIPFEQVVELAQPVRSLAHTPLFQVMFGWQNASQGRLELPGLRLGGVGSASQAAAKFDLSLSLGEAGGRIAGSLTYATALFEQATVERHLAYLRRVLEAFAADDLQAVDALPLLPEAERRLVVEEWNATDAAYDRELCIHALFEAQVARAPGAAAVVFEGGELTYAELNARANRLAHHLIGRGVGPGARVAVCVERGPAMVVGLLAILKAGGAYVPLDPSYPAERLRYVLHDSAPAAVLTQRSLEGVEALFAGVEAPVIDLEGAEWAQCPETDPGRAGLTPGHLAYVIYTSGSTGAPKGVMVEHRSLVNHTAWQAGAFGLGPDDTVLQRTSISFDASVWELWTPLAVGARLVLLPVHAAKDPGAIARVIEERGVTIVQFVPTLLQAVLRALPEGASLRPRIVFCGGEPLTEALVAEARARGVEEVVNLYGPTEATIDATACRCADDGRAPGIGSPVGNVRVYIVDGAGEPVPVGVTGELYIGGDGVARGYLDRPGLTAERFVADPFSARAGARLYRTGDLGRWRADGTIEFLGRNDFQVKIRGFRIEPGEVEARLLEHPGVREAAVLAREDAPGDRRLVAYIVGPDSVAVDALRAHLSERLPEYMVPAAYVRLEALPLTPNGKLDRKALPAPEGDAFATRGYEAPVGETEQALAEIWSELLGVERIGRHDDFFELGGHSMLAVRLALWIQRSLDVDVTLRDVFEKPVLSTLAQHVVHAQLAQFDPEELARLGALLDDDSAPG